MSSLIEEERETAPSSKPAVRLRRLRLRKVKSTSRSEDARCDVILASTSTREENVSNRRPSESSMSYLRENGNDLSSGNQTPVSRESAAVESTCSSAAPHIRHRSGSGPVRDVPAAAVSCENTPDSEGKERRRLRRRRRQQHESSGEFRTAGDDPAGADDHPGKLGASDDRGVSPVESNSNRESVQRPTERRHNEAVEPAKQGRETERTEVSGPGDEDGPVISASSVRQLKRRQRRCAGKSTDTQAPPGERECIESSRDDEKRRLSELDGDQSAFHRQRRRRRVRDDHLNHAESQPRDSTIRTWTTDCQHSVRGDVPSQRPNGVERSDSPAFDDSSCARLIYTSSSSSSSLFSRIKTYT